MTLYWRNALYSGKLSIYLRLFVVSRNNRSARKLFRNENGLHARQICQQLSVNAVKTIIRKVDSTGFV